jgi:hypothetical protein
MLDGAIGDTVPMIGGFLNQILGLALSEGM